MFDFLITNHNVENPTVMSILITVLFSFFLSSLLVITYDFTTKSIHRPAHFLQSIALISIVAATVMQAIGDSLARGLGMLGALSIIRFRTVLDDPRNMTFMFASLAVGIASGVFGFSIAFIGTVAFCLGAIILRFSPLSNTNDLIGTLRIEIPKEGQQESSFNKILSRYCFHFELQQIRFLNTRKKEQILDEEGQIVDEISKDHLKELHYLIRLKRNTSVDQFVKEISDLGDLGDIRLRFDKKNIRL